jgi:hypothetical protein
MLSAISKQLKTQLYAIVPPKLQQNTREITTKHKPLLNIFFQTIQSNYKKIQRILNNNHSISVQAAKTPLDKLREIQFLDINDRKKIEKITNTVQLSCTYKTNTIHILVSSDKSIKHEFQLRIFTKLFTLIDLFTDKKNEVFSLNIWLSNLKKKITPTVRRIITSSNVNSGATFHNLLDESSELFIWREEEIEKVLVHEMIHSLKLDFFDYPQHLQKDFYKIFNIPTTLTIKLGEAYVESWAIILNSIFVAISLNNNNNNNNSRNSFQQFLSIFADELMFSLFQCSKILIYYKFQCVKNCENSFLHQFQNINKFQQETSVFSYYIIKTGILVNLHAFLKYCCFENKKLLDFQPEPTKFRKFHNLLVSKILHKDSPFLTILQDYFTALKENSGMPRKLIDPLKYTMRMSLYEINI